MKTINSRSIFDPLSNKEMKNVTGGGEGVGTGSCSIRCFTGDDPHPIADCEHDTIVAYKCDDLTKLVCSCAGA